MSVNVHANNTRLYEGEQDTNTTMTYYIMALGLSGRDPDGGTESYVHGSLRTASGRSRAHRVVIADSKECSSCYLLDNSRTCTYVIHSIQLVEVSMFVPFQD